jgi:transposase InsO family protein
MCDALAVSVGGYYAWKARPASARAGRRERVVAEIRAAHAASRGTYGSPRVHAELKEAGVAACENTVAKYMRQESIVAVTHRRRPGVRTTDSSHGHPVAENVLARDFHADAPDRKWCVDITYVATGEGWLYLAAVMDLCSRRIVGWAMADHLRSELCDDALRMAVANRRPGTGLPHHGDRGVQYCCHAYRALLEQAGMLCSMSGRSDCYDNAAMESFWGTLKREHVYLTAFATRAEARLSLFEYIEVFYNRRRRHSAIGYKSPEAFEASLNRRMPRRVCRSWGRSYCHR